MRERGHAIPVREWWLRLARGLIAKDTRDLTTLGKELARHVREKKTPFSYTALSNFALGKTACTVELAEALCTEYRLPPPVYFPDSYEESVEMLRTAERYERLADSPSAEADVVAMPMARRPRRKKAEAAAVSTDAPVARRRSR